SWKGSLLPKGTIAFSQLPTSDNVAGHMYNISDAFETDSRFKDGAGYAYAAGTNVYWTTDEKWDCLSGAITMELTMAEYNALSDAQKMNGTIYYISDADNSIPSATENFDGLMSHADKQKLDGIEDGANAYSLPLASKSVRGGVKIGYTQNGNNYPVQLNSDEQMYVNINLQPEDIGVAKNSGYDCYGECKTAANVAAKTVTVNGDFELRNDMRVYIKFINSHSLTQNCNITLNVNGTGDYPILYQGRPVKAGEIVADGIYQLLYTGSAYEIVGATIPEYAVFPRGMVSSVDNLAEQFRTQTKGDELAGNYLSIFKNECQDVEYAPQHGVGLAFGSGNTHGYLYTDHSSPHVYLGGGDDNGLNWVEEVAFRKELQPRCSVGQYGTAVSNRPWYKAASITLPDEGGESEISFLVSKHNGGIFGILTVYVTRYAETSQNGALYRGTCHWEHATSPEASAFRLCISHDSPTVAELWAYAGSNSCVFHFYRLCETYNSSTNPSIRWTLHDCISEGGEAALPAGYSEYTPSFSTIYNANMDTYSAFVASRLSAARQIKIGATSKGFDGTTDLTYTIPEIVGNSNSIVYYGICSTSYTTRNKYVSVNSAFMLVDGVRVCIRFTSTHNTTAAIETLNVNGTGSKAARTSNGEWVYYVGGTSQILEFIYNASADAWIVVSETGLSTYYSAEYNGLAIRIEPHTASGIAAHNGAGTVVFSACAHGLIPLAPNGGSTETTAWAFNLGSGTAGWGTLYAQKSVVSTSDKNKKSNIDTLDSRYLELFDTIPMRKYVLNGGTDTLTTTKNRRYHLGVIAQDVENVVRDLGMTSDDFGGVCSEYFACYGSFKASIHGGWREKKDERGYSDNVYNWKHRNDTGVEPYEIYNEIMEEQIANLHIDSYRKNIGYIMIEDNSKLTKEQPSVTINSMSLVDYEGNITPIRFTDFLRYYTSDDTHFENPLSDVVIHEDGSATISFNRMYGCAWLKLSEVIDISKYSSVIIDVDYIGEYTVVFIPDGEYQNANPYDRDRNDQILYNYSFRYDELFALTAYALQETRKEFDRYREQVDETIRNLTYKIDCLAEKVEN
ncbi:MAG: hypothetical protein HDR02_00285, partial [Lachnospiraceae bacterium]|nr:hypothetical protein [Lachnospiraceae bacterium]